MARSRSLCLAVAAFALLSCYVGAQEYDESGEFCRKYKKTCPDDPSRPYEKYCCINVLNRVPYPACCSPYFGIEIGAGIGIPVVILLVISVIAGYCCCLKVQQRRLARRQAEEDDSDSEDGESPLQRYSRLDVEKPPGYSADDPFPTPPQYSPTPGEEGEAAAVTLQVNPMTAGDTSTPPASTGSQTTQTGSDQGSRTGSNQGSQTGSGPIPLVEFSRMPCATGSSQLLRSEEDNPDLDPPSYCDDSAPLIGSGHAP